MVGRSWCALIALLFVGCSSGGSGGFLADAAQEAGSAAPAVPPDATSRPVEDPSPPPARTDAADAPEVEEPVVDAQPVDVATPREDAQPEVGGCKDPLIDCPPINGSALPCCTADGQCGFGLPGFVCLPSGGGFPGG
jgi:hypothetical protein